MKVIEFSNVQKSFNGFKLKVSFEVKKGEIFALVGPNGSGKTTIISILLNLKKPDKGKVRVFGMSYDTSPLEIKKEIAAVLDLPTLYEDLTVLDNLLFRCKLLGVENPTEKIQEVLRRFGLKKHSRKKVKELSFGTRRRVDLAKCFLKNFELLVLDEPFLGVDIRGRKELMEFLLELKREGKTILLSTNLIEGIWKQFDRVAILRRGRVVRMGKPVKLIRELNSKVLEILDSEDPEGLLKLLKKERGVKKVQLLNSKVWALVKEGAKRRILEKLRKEVEVTPLIRDASFEDVFFYWCS